MTVAKVLATLQEHGPLTVKQIAMELGCTNCYVARRIKEVRAESPGVIRIAEVRLGRFEVFALGPGEDVVRMPLAQVVIETLRDNGPLSVNQIAELTGFKSKTISEAVLAMRRADAVRDEKFRRIHIKRWARAVGRGGRETAVYAHGPGADAPLPDFKRTLQARYNEKRRMKRLMAGAIPRPPRRIQTVNYDALFRLG